MARTLRAAAPGADRPDRDGTIGPARASGEGVQWRQENKEVAVEATPEMYERARARVRQLKLLYIHLATYGVVMLMLFAINATGTDAEQGNWWVVYPALAWGAALLVHVVLVVTGGLSSWEDRKVESLVERQQAGGVKRAA
jgi:hypothetical protein